MFSRQAVCKVLIYLWFVEDWSWFQKFSALQVGLLWFKFKINSGSMFFPMGRGVLKMPLQRGLYELFFILVRGWCFKIKVSAEMSFKRVSSMEGRYWNFKAMKCFQEMHSMRLTVFRKMQCFTALKMTDVMCHFWPSAFFL